MVFGPSAAGTIAQVLAVLLLATAFTPSLAGALSTKWVTGDDGMRYRVSTLKKRLAGTYAKTRLAMVVAVLVVMFIDCLIVMSDAKLGGVWRMLAMCINAGAFGFAASTLAYTIFEHMSSDDEPDRNRTDSSR